MLKPLNVSVELGVANVVVVVLTVNVEGRSAEATPTLKIPTPTVAAKTDRTALRATDRRA
jgi:hypothetical protein